MSTAIDEKRLSTKRAERGARRRARQSKAHPDCRSTTIKSCVKKISLALLPGRDNHPLAATAKMAILIVAVFSSRLSRYSNFIGSPFTVVLFRLRRAISGITPDLSVEPDYGRGHQRGQAGSRSISNNLGLTLI